MKLIVIIFLFGPNEKGDSKSHSESRLKVVQGDSKSKHKIEFEIGLKVLSGKNQDQLSHLFLHQDRDEEFSEWPSLIKIGFSESANGLTLIMEWKESKLNKGQTAIKMVKKTEIEWLESIIFTSKLNYVNGKYADHPLHLTLRKVFLLLSPLFFEI